VYNSLLGSRQLLQMIASLDDIPSNLHSSTSLPYKPYNMVQYQTNDMHDTLFCTDNIAYLVFILNKSF